MSGNIVDHMPLAAFRRSVFGFIAGTSLGAAFVALVFAFDVGSIAALSARSGGAPLGELGLLPVSFGLLGLLVAPAIGGGSDGDAG
jgi:hypothetical protein